MRSHILTRAAVAATTTALLLPLTGCGSAQPNPEASGSTRSPSASTSSAPPASAPPTSAPPATVPAAPTAYKDGAYTVRGVYGGAPSYMTITLTLRSDAITEVVVEPMPENNDISRGYQERFAEAVPGVVTGKSLDDADVGVLAGASGCAVGFNDALAKIRSEAATNN